MKSKENSLNCNRGKLLVIETRAGLYDNYLLFLGINRVGYLGGVFS